jgi:hypothetical protein
MVYDFCQTLYKVHTLYGLFTADTFVVIIVINKMHILIILGTYSVNKMLQAM